MNSSVIRHVRFFLRTVAAVSAVMIVCALSAVSTAAENSVPAAVGRGESFWWQKEYRDLCTLVEDAPGHTKSTSYRTGPGGRDVVSVVLTNKPGEGMILKMTLPKGALFDSDLMEAPAEVSFAVVTIRDHDLDGMLDDFRIEPSKSPANREAMTKDGFIKYKTHRDYEVILFQWTVGIGYAVNRFLHNIDSPFP